MFEIREGCTCVNGAVFQTFERDAREDGVSLEVEAGTTGFCGGGRKEGGRAYLRIQNEGADFFARVLENDDKRPEGVVLAVCGDNEIVALIKALDFAAQVLRDQVEEIND
ncbi:MAG: hypothetical protein IJV41_02390 [Oscillospiraceae bacterium]|nr:hypothetical protein [Parasporobacterium sp.]MBQ9685383.1 hypothetical protein [Oscillospiraceae bacterium]